MPVSDQTPVAVSIVVPVRNEADNIAPLIAEIAAALDGRWAYEIVYVNDGSTDGSADNVIRLAQNEPGLHALAQPRNTGKGAAVFAAFNYAVD
ncbi:MAG: glycosyltransferase family 2 protein, partial [Bradyrhizobium sp.]|uniref:glycosyltransferase family 2 protein n=1 Tax=Bradyrhizobium sp. TaxID=376 RepID=UPI00391C4E13